MLNQCDDSTVPQRKRGVDTKRAQKEDEDSAIRILVTGNVVNDNTTRKSIMVEIRFGLLLLLYGHSSDSTQVMYPFDSKCILIGCNNLLIPSNSIPTKSNFISRLDRYFYTFRRIYIQLTYRSIPHRGIHVTKALPKKTDGEDIAKEYEETKQDVLTKKQKNNPMLECDVHTLDTITKDNNIIETRSEYEESKQEYPTKNHLINVLIQHPNGSTKVTTFNNSDINNETLYNQTSIILNIPKEEIRLIYGTKEIPPPSKNAIIYIHLKNGCFLDVRLRLKGGADADVDVYREKQDKKNFITTQRCSRIYDGFKVIPKILSGTRQQIVPPNKKFKDLESLTIHTCLEYIFPNGSVHIIPPEMSSVNNIFSKREDVAQEAMTELLKTIIEFKRSGLPVSIAEIEDNDAILDKPIIFVTSTMCQDKNLNENLTGNLEEHFGHGCHWVCIVITPRGFIGLLGERDQPTQNEQIYLVDSLGSNMTLPLSLKERLTTKWRWSEPPSEKSPLGINVNFPAPLAQDVTIHNYSTLMTQSRNSCGYWAMFNAIMIVITGGTSYYELLQKTSKNDNTSIQIAEQALRLTFEEVIPYILDDKFQTPYLTTDNILDVNYTSQNHRFILALEKDELNPETENDWLNLRCERTIRATHIVDVKSSVKTPTKEPLNKDGNNLKNENKLTSRKTRGKNKSKTPAKRQNEDNNSKHDSSGEPAINKKLKQDDGKNPILIQSKISEYVRSNNYRREPGREQGTSGQRVRAKSALDSSRVEIDSENEDGSSKAQAEKNLNTNDQASDSELLMRQILFLDNITKALSPVNLNTGEQEITTTAENIVTGQLQKDATTIDEENLSNDPTSCYDKEFSERIQRIEESMTQKMMKTMEEYSFKFGEQLNTLLVDNATLNGKIKKLESEHTQKLLDMNEKITLLIEDSNKTKEVCTKRAQETENRFKRLENKLNQEPEKNESDTKDTSTQQDDNHTNTTNKRDIDQGLVRRLIDEMQNLNLIIPEEENPRVRIDTLKHLQEDLEKWKEEKINSLTRQVDDLKRKTEEKLNAHDGAIRELKACNNQNLEKITQLAAGANRINIRLDNDSQSNKSQGNDGIKENISSRSIDQLQKMIEAIITPKLEKMDIETEKRTTGNLCELENKVKSQLEDRIKDMQKKENTPHNIPHTHRNDPVRNNLTGKPRVTRIYQDGQIIVTTYRNIMMHKGDLKAIKEEAIEILQCPEYQKNWKMRFIWNNIMLHPTEEELKEAEGNMKRLVDICKSKERVEYGDRCFRRDKTPEQTENLPENQ